MLYIFQEQYYNLRVDFLGSTKQEGLTETILTPLAR